MNCHKTMAHNVNNCDWLKCPYCSETFKFQTHFFEHLKICPFYVNPNPDNKCHVCGEEFSLGLYTYDQ